jgi:hypothetical protein
MDAILQIISKVFNINLSKQQLFLKAENFFSQSQFKILLFVIFLCFVFLCCVFKPIAVIVATIGYSSLYFITYTLALFKVPVFFFTFIVALAIQYWIAKYYIIVVLLSFISFFCFCYLFRNNFFVSKSDPNLRKVFFENFEEEKTKFLCFNVLLTFNCIFNIVEFYVFLIHHAELGFFYSSLNSEDAVLLQSVYLSFSFFGAVSCLLSCLILAFFRDPNYTKDLYYLNLFVDIFCASLAALIFLFWLFIILFINES